ncbi:MULTISPECIES: restriction endonuclease subunit S [unclassified Salinivibrio]|uniref:restriction endonuclease subunit S n=1 Tax=unclassified Salinivibrio TaxID=2636825 RepID=UPI00128D48A5|nr:MULTISPECIES: restriction endonuclease subunit S [unclassified Salinivibrio]MPS32629.1 restriction endonuclease subunit S [Salinivibrio sp. VYel7]MPX94020.1 restriction endonuclease subunit S [Salinivibrio sp. VYel9]MPY00120.1 restriction endonuclease subunit S [Salinivibrio sp. VYel4]MPY03188.1 restriction endonuclease subunit S [Salinivibrio sp. VYel5]
MAERSEAMEEQTVRDGSAVYSVEPEFATAEYVPPGYKRTEVGVIPEDWEVKHLSELGISYAGLTYKPSNVRSFGSLVLRSSNIKDGKLVFNSDDVFVDATIPPRAIVREGDILICVRNGSARLIGKCARIPKSAEGHAFGAFMTVFRANDDGLTFYLFQSDIVQRQIQERMGATINQITGKDLSEFLVPVPTAAGEKRAIATALSDADALIESLDRLIAKKRAIKQAAMQQLLTCQTRLPGFSGEWETKRLGEIADIEMGQSPSSKFYNRNGEGLPLIQGNADIDDRRTIRRISTTQVTKRGQRGDVLLSVRAPVGEVSRATFDVCLGRGVCALRFPNDFLFHYLVFIEPSWAKHSKGSTFDSVSSADIRNLEMELPGAEEQIAIATVLSDMDTEIEALEQRREKARQIKQGMMQQLLTGRVRLIEETREDASYG